MLVYEIHTFMKSVILHIQSTTNGFLQYTVLYVYSIQYTVYTTIFEVCSVVCIFSLQTNLTLDLQEVDDNHQMLDEQLKDLRHSMAGSSYNTLSSQHRESKRSDRPAN